MASLTGTETASSSGAPRRWIYDVFLSFRGADTRNNFVDHLYDALIRRSVHTFKDDEQLETGMSIPLELLRAIQESMFAIVVFSRNYATSSWCLDELVKIMECRNLTGLTVIPVFYQVEPSVIRYQTGSFADAFAKHEVRCKEKVPGWRKALIEVTSISGLDVSNTANGRESKCIEILVDKIVQEKSHMVSSVVEQFVGADSLVENIQPLSLRKIQKDLGNIIHNHDFSWGVDEPWKLMHKEYTFIHRYGYKGIPAAKEGSTHFAWVKHRTEKWQGLEQEITSKFAPDTIYMLSACIQLRNVEPIAKVQATLRLERREKKEKYLNIGRTLIRGQQWEEIQGFTFRLPHIKGARWFFYLEGPPPEVDLLIDSVALKEVKQFTSNIKDINIIQNPEFLEDGKQWARNLCRAEFSKSLGCARTTNRVKYYSGIEQDISARVQKGLVYELNAEVRVSGDGEDDVDATIHIRRHNLSTSIGLVARALATKKSWVKLEGKFLLPCAPLTAVICLNGSPPGTDIFVRGPRVCARQAPADLDLQNASSHGILVVQ